MSKVSIAAKNVPFEAFLIVFLFCGVSRCHKEFVPHNGNGGHRVPLRNAPAGTAWPLFVQLLQVNGFTCQRGLWLKAVSKGPFEFLSRGLEKPKYMFVT